MIYYPIFIEIEYIFIEGISWIRFTLISKHKFTCNR